MEKPIYQLYDEFVIKYQVCRCKVENYGRTMVCLHASDTGKDMEAHIRKEHPEQITKFWRKR